MSRPNSSAPRTYFPPGRARFSMRLCFAGSWGASQGARAAAVTISMTMTRPTIASRFRRNRRQASPTSLSVRSATGASASTAVLKRGPGSSEHPVSAVDADRLAGDVPGVVRGEEEHGAGDVLGLPEPAEGDALDELPLARVPHRLPLALARGVGADESRRHAVDADAELAELPRRLPREPDQPRLGAGVCLDSGETVRATRAGGDVHDAPAAARLHGRNR